MHETRFIFSRFAQALNFISLSVIDGLAIPVPVVMINKASK
ncbi:hypothetical protein CBM2614_A290002 [Cupriavidus taiwanensis]|nr:hypothetical protein CBM2614_A290002 [Cupriavidus taiwanensis]